MNYEKKDRVAFKIRENKFQLHLLQQKNSKVTRKRKFHSRPNKCVVRYKRRRRYRNRIQSVFQRSVITFEKRYSRTTKHTHNK